MLDNPITKLVFTLIVLLIITLALNYYTTETKMGSEMRQQVTDTLFGVFTEEYDHNAETPA